MIDQRLAPTSAFLTTSAEPLDHNPAAVYLARLSSERSRRVMSQALRVLAALLTNDDPRTVDPFAVDWSALHYAHTAALRSRLLDIYGPSTVNRCLSALRGVLKEAWRLGYISAETYQRAADFQSVRAETLPAGRELSQGELWALVDTCKADQSSAGIRDAAMIGILYTCGLRRAELVALMLADFDADSSRLSIRAGKGRKQRAVYVQGGARRALLDWLMIRGDRLGALFVPVLKSGHLSGQTTPMSSQTVYDMLKKRALQAGVRDFSPHDMRRTFVGDMLDRGVDIATVANIAGHASVDTTRRYDRRPEATKRQAAEKLHFPY